MTAITRWPPYLRMGPDGGEGVSDAHFSDFEPFHRHDTLPFVMRRDYYESGDTTGTFRHVDFLGLYVVRSGRAVHWIDNHPYGLVRGDIYLMAPGATHRFCQFTELELDVFFFQHTLFNNEELAALRDCNGIKRLFVGDIEMGHRIHLRPEVWRLIESQIELMRNAWGDTSRAGALRLKHEFFRLLIDLGQQLEAANQAPAPGDEQHPGAGLTEALRFCEEHFDKPLSVPRLAARAFLSAPHFSELFSCEVGMPPAAYVRYLRLEKACSLLRETKMPIAQVATTCGFRNASQFSRTFRNWFETSPLQYRKRERMKL